MTQARGSFLKKSPMIFAFVWVCSSENLPFKFKMVARLSVWDGPVDEWQSPTSTAICLFLELHSESSHPHLFIPSPQHRDLQGPSDLPYHHFSSTAPVLLLQWYCPMVCHLLNYWGSTVARQPTWTLIITLFINTTLSFKPFLKSTCIVVPY